MNDEERGKLVVLLFVGTTALTIMLTERVMRLGTKVDELILTLAHSAVIGNVTCVPRTHT